MAVVGSVQALFSSDTTQWTAGCNKAKADLDSVDKKGGDVFKNLKKQFGRKCEIGEAMELFKTAGAFGAIIEGTRALSEMTSKAVELKTQFAEGKISQEEMNVKIAESIPLFGSLVTTGKNLADLISGEGVIREQNNKRMEQAKEFQKEQAKAAAEEQKLAITNANELLKIQREILKLKATPLEAAKIDAQNKSEDAHATIEEKRKAALDAFDLKSEKDSQGTMAAKALIEYNKQIADQKARLRDGRGIGGIKDLIVSGLPGGTAAIEKEAKDKITALQKHEAIAQATWISEQKRRSKERMEIEHQFDAQEATEEEKSKTAAVKDDSKHMAEVSKQKDAIQKQLLDEQTKAKIAAYRTAGDEQSAAIAEINQRSADERAKNLEDAHAKLKELSISEASDEGKAYLESVQEVNRAISVAATKEKQDKIKEIQDRKKAEHDAIMGEGMGAVEKLKAEESKLEAERKKGIISVEEFQQKKTELEKKFRESLGESKELEPYQKYQDDVIAFKKAMDAKIISVDEFKIHVADAQAELLKATQQEFKANEHQEIRRFTFGSLSTPKMANPNKDLLSVQKDQKKIQQDIHTAILQSNALLKSGLSTDNISLVGAGAGY